MSRAESSKRLKDSLPPPPLEKELPVESMVTLALLAILPDLLHPKGVLLCCPTVFVAFLASIVHVTRSHSSPIGHF